MDNQTLIVTILVLLSLNVLFVGVYLVLILREARTSISKVNRILSTVDNLTSAVSQPVIGIAQTVEGFRQGFRIVDSLADLKKAFSVKKTGVKVSQEDRGSE